MLHTCRPAEAWKSVSLRNQGLSDLESKPCHHGTCAVIDQRLLSTCIVCTCASTSRFLDAAICHFHCQIIEMAWKIFFNKPIFWFHPDRLKLDNTICKKSSPVTFAPVDPDRPPELFFNILLEKKLASRLKFVLIRRAFWATKSDLTWALTCCRNEN